MSALAKKLRTKASSKAKKGDSAKKRAPSPKAAESDPAKKSPTDASPKATESDPAKNRSTRPAPNVEFTLAMILREILGRCFDNREHAMLRAINKRALGSHKLTKERLQAIYKTNTPSLEGGNESKLNWSDLHFLDAFIQEHERPGLANFPMLTSASLADTLLCSGTHKLNIYLGSRVDTGRFNTTNIRAWDMRAALDFLKKSALHGNIDCDLHEGVIQGNEVTASLMRLPTSVGTMQELMKPWSRRLMEPGIHLSIGAPYANPVTELMLAKMFRVDPFHPSENWNLPFYFLWNSDVFNPYSSSFSANAAVLAKFHLSHHPVVQAAANGRARALLYTDETQPTSFRLFPENPSNEGIQGQGDFGGVLCVAPIQSTAGESTSYWVAIIGMTGAATKAIADYCCKENQLGVHLSCAMMRNKLYWLPFRTSGTGALFEDFSRAGGPICSPLLKGNFREFGKIDFGVDGSAFPAGT